MNSRDTRPIPSFLSKAYEGSSYAFRSDSDLGNVLFAEYPWVFSDDYGWLFFGAVEFEESEPGSVWLYFPDLGYVYSSEDAFPYVYSVSLETWTYLHQDELGQNWYYDFSRDSWQSWSVFKNEGE